MTLQAVDASVLPTRGTGELPAAVQYDAVLTLGTLSKLPNGVLTYPHDHYEKLLPGEDASADTVASEIQVGSMMKSWLYGGCAAALHACRRRDFEWLDVVKQGSFTAATGEKGIDASAGLISWEDTEGSSMDHAAIATQRSHWDSHEADSSLVSMTASTNMDSSATSLPHAIEGALSHEETLEYEASELETGKNNSADPSKLMLSLPSQILPKPSSPLSRVPQSPSPEGLKRAPSKRSRLGMVPDSPHELPLGVSEPSIVSTVLAPLEESTQSVVQSPAAASAPAPAPAQPAQQPRGRLQRMQKDPQKAANEVGAPTRGPLVKESSRRSDSSRSSDDDSLVAALVGKRKLKVYCCG